MRLVVAANLFALGFCSATGFALTLAGHPIATVNVACAGLNLVMAAVNWPKGGAA